MKTLLFAILLLLGTVFWTSCEQPYCRKDYVLDFPLEASADTIGVGDTIWYSMDIREPLLDNATGDLVNMKPFDLYFKFKIGRLDTVYANYDDKYFTTVVDKGLVEQLNNPEFGTFWKFESQEDKQFRIGLVALQAGVFRSELVFPYEYNILENPQLRANRGNIEGLKVSQSRCDQFITGSSRIITNEGDNNYPFLQQNICQQYSPVDTNTLCWDSNFPVGALRTGYFAFVVL